VTEEGYPVLDIVRYCKVCGKLEDHEVHNRLMPTPEYISTIFIGHHKFEPDIPWDYAGGLDEVAQWEPKEVAEWEKLKENYGDKIAKTFRRNPGKPGMVAMNAWDRLCAAEDAEDDDE
jgi:hypothetical protein